MLIASGTSMGVPGRTPTGRPTSKAPSIVTGSSPSSGVSATTGWPSLSMSSNRNWCSTFVRSHGTWMYAAIADALGSGPVTDQPPPRM